MFLPGFHWHLFHIFILRNVLRCTKTFAFSGSLNRFQLWKGDGFLTVCFIVFLEDFDVIELDPALNSEVHYIVAQLTKYMYVFKTIIQKYDFDISLCSFWK